MGRLLRHENDYGTITILDNRLVTRKYGEQILRSFNPDLKIITGDIENITKENKTFFDSKENDKLL